MQAIEAIENSPAFIHWRGAFREVTGIDIHLVGGPDLEGSLRRAAGSNQLCQVLWSRSPGCAACRRRLIARMQAANDGARHAGFFAIRCVSGMTVAALPFSLADGSVVFRRTDPVCLHLRRPVPAAELAVRRMTSGRECLPPALVRRLASGIPERDRKQFNAALVLLGLLAARLSHLSLQLLGDAGHDWQEHSAARRCRDIIERRFTEDLHIDQVARELGVSRSYLSHLCTRCLGLPFTAYLTGRRVAELKRLLEDSELSITEAMFAAGFQSISQSNRVFLAAVGMSPREFRARFRQGRGNGAAASSAGESRAARAGQAGSG